MQASMPTSPPHPSRRPPPDFPACERPDTSPPAGLRLQPSPLLMPLLVLPLLLLGGCGGGGQSRSAGRCKPVACRQVRQLVLDLSHPLQAGMVTSPGAAPLRMASNATGGAPAASSASPDNSGPPAIVEMALDSGTHIDAPDPRPSVSQLPVDELVLETVVIDVRARTKEQADFRITVNDLEDWEAAEGSIPIGSLVIANTGWHARFADAAKYLNRDSEGAMHFPGFGLDAIQLLIERDVAAVGIDTMQLGGGGDAEAAKQLLAANKFVIENLANLDPLPPKGSRVMIGVLALVDAPRAPARIVALVPEPEPKNFGD